MNKVFNYIKGYRIAIIYSSGSIIKAFTQIFVSFVIAKYVSPENLGIWTALNLVLTYSVLFQGGIINGFNLELPLAYGEGNETKAKLLAATTQTFVVGSILFIFIFGLIVFVIYPFENNKYKYGYLAVLLVIILTFYQNYLSSTFRSNNSFEKLAYIQLIDAFFNLVSLILIIYFMYYGMIIKSVVVLMMHVILLYLYRPLKVGLTWDKSTFKTLLKIGIPIFALVYIDSVSSTVDKLLLLKFGSVKEVGLYSFAFYSYTAITLFSASIASYIYPRMTYNYGKDKNVKKIWIFVKKITFILIIIQIPLGIIGVVILPYLLKTYFETYILSLVPMQILLFAGIIKGCTVGVNALWSMKKWKYMYIYQISYSICLVTCPLLCLIFIKNLIVSVSVGFLAANFINLIIGLYLTYHVTQKGTIEI